MEQLDLNQIRTFVRIVQAGSFTKAAEILRQPKSRVSRRLAALEKELGVQLIYRTTRQFQLTENGKIYYERSRGLIEGLENLTAELNEETSEVSGLIKITASDDMGVTKLAPVLDDFTKQYPRVRFEVLLTQAYVDLVKESVDVAIRIGNLKDSSLRVKKISSLRNIFVATPGFLERYRHAEDFNQLPLLPFIGLGNAQQVKVIRNSDGKKLTAKVNPVLTTNNPSMMVAMALTGKGISLIPEFLCTDHIRAGRLVHVYKGYQSDEVQISMVTPEQKEVPLKVKKFVEFAAKRLKEIFNES
ncbi:LysR family transcriptional regulator [Bdellovibrio sp. NC01]|uniref:LysR family transcriptional regulator n=1 Tax=Bdellovibrio sp. NC01 TaxID=2220073 RepID=UPI00115973A4|nr:LysR family transcriptional regulator [Bdellovibrio sp. NC01]QDK36947.1 LysR family transcriptional regulator [Bdellovibrio sp. NC01]